MGAGKGKQRHRRHSLSATCGCRSEFLSAFLFRRLLLADSDVALLRVVASAREKIPTFCAEDLFALAAESVEVGPLLAAMSPPASFFRASSVAAVV